MGRILLLANSNMPPNVQNTVGFAALFNVLVSAYVAFGSGIPEAVGDSQDWLCRLDGDWLSVGLGYSEVSYYVGNVAAVFVLDVVWRDGAKG